MWDVVIVALLAVGAGGRAIDGQSEDLLTPVQAQPTDADQGLNAMPGRQLLQGVPTQYGPIAALAGTWTGTTVTDQGQTYNSKHTIGFNGDLLQEWTEPSTTGSGTARVVGTWSANVLSITCFPGPDTSSWYQVVYMYKPSSVVSGGPKYDCAIVKRTGSILLWVDGKAGYLQTTASTNCPTPYSYSGGTVVESTDTLIHYSGGVPLLTADQTRCSFWPSVSLPPSSWRVAAPPPFYYRSSPPPRWRSSSPPPPSSPPPRWRSSSPPPPSFGPSSRGTYYDDNFLPQSNTNGRLLAALLVPGLAWLVLGVLLCISANNKLELESGNSPLAIDPVDQNKLPVAAPITTNGTAVAAQPTANGFTAFDGITQPPGGVAASHSPSGTSDSSLQSGAMHATVMVSTNPQSPLQPAAVASKEPFNWHLKTLLTDIVIWASYVLLTVGATMPNETSTGLRSTRSRPGLAKLFLVIFGSVGFAVGWFMHFCFALGSANSRNGKKTEYLQSSAKITANGASERVKTLQRMDPTMSWTIECYHMETRVVTTYVTDSHGNSTPATTTVTVPVTTFTASESLVLARSTDSTGNADMLRRLEIYTRLRVTLDCEPGDDFSRVAWDSIRERLVQQHSHRDVLHRIYSSVTIDGSAEHCYMISDDSCCTGCVTSTSMYMLSVFLVLDWFYLLWIGECTHSLVCRVRKHFYVA